MKKEDMFRAIGEVREEQVQEAFSPRRPLSWRRYAALAACLALLAAAALKMPPGSPGEIDRGSEPQSSDQGGTDFTLDGAPEGYYGLTDDLTGAREDEKTKFYSQNVEIGQFSEPPAADSEVVQDTSASLRWLEPEEIFAMDTDIFRGTVENVLYFFTEGGYNHSFTVISVCVSEVYALRSGTLSPGDTCSIYLPVSSGISISSEGDLGQLAVGSEAIFMPRAAAADTGIERGESYFCYADVADYYFGEGHRFLFLDTGDALSFARETYKEITDASTLDEVGAYIRRMLPDEAQTGEVSTASYAPEERCIGVPLHDGT